MFLSVSKTQEMLLEKVIKIVQMLDMSNFFTSVFHKEGMKECNERKKKLKLTLSAFSDM